MTGRLEVVRVGSLATIQDLGRPGRAHLGVPRSGALDEPALRLANRLLGNPDGAAGLELTLAGGTFRTHAATTVALTGALATVTVGGRAYGFATAVPVPAGATVHVGPAVSGVRSYLAVAGGVAVAPVLGSRSTDTLSGLGPAPLAAGDELPIGDPPTGVPGAPDVVPWRTHGDTVELRIRFGPRDDRFAGGGRGLCGTPYRLGSDSNRVGARLTGPGLTRVDAGELASEGVVLGAVQVTADGRPLVFLADHPTTGGYPVVGVVDRADLSALAQARPGDTVVFRSVTQRRWSDGPER